MKRLYVSTLGDQTSCFYLDPASIVCIENQDDNERIEALLDSGQKIILYGDDGRTKLLADFLEGSKG